MFIKLYKEKKKKPKHYLYVKGKLDPDCFAQSVDHLRMNCGAIWFAVIAGPFWPLPLCVCVRLCCQIQGSFTELEDVEVFIDKSMDN